MIWVQHGPFGEGWDPKARSANLWFGRINDDDGYRCWEVSYRENDSGRPFGLDHWWEPKFVKLDAPPRAIDNEHLEDFLDRWGGHLGELAG